MWKWQAAVLLIVTLLACAIVPAVSQGGQAKAQTPQRIVLGNGLTVILAPIPGMRQVAIESFYRTGIADEPREMPLSSLLVMGAVCSGGTKSYKPGEAVKLLSAKGMTNGEVMPGCTHYDYLVPANSLELALRVEAERLGSLNITPDVLNEQIPVCYEQVNFVEGVPEAGMFKFAFTALNQAWRYRADAVSLKSGLESYSLQNIRQYHAARYQPQEAVLVLAGDFNKDKTLKLIQKYLANLQAGKTSTPVPVRWEALPRQADVKWDSSVSAVCIAFRPPDNDTDRRLLNLWGCLLMQRLCGDEWIAQAAEHVSCTNPFIAIGDLPFFIYATPKDGTEPSELQRALDNCLRDALSRQSEDEINSLLTWAGQIGKTPIPPAAMLRRLAKTMMPKEMDAKTAQGFMLGNVAMQFGIEELLTGGKDYSVAPNGAKPADVITRLKQALDPSRAYVTTLIPAKEAGE